ncbi:MAG: acyl-CoA thioesterase [Ignavibacteriaceae bacterium]|jgi:YbgC/YbaW family acyl-CoA thioester hydrolase|nr:acyl-CoA thioesterase [Ignavibacteriaceae bacterium]MBP9121556.1 acyl-CoA thioesterase [Ignavibacteriaceae bacterium]
MNNHVHFTKYLDYVLAARYDQMENNYKFPMDEFVKSGLTWVVSKTTIEYKRSLVMGDVALVETGIHSYSGSNCIVDFVIYNKKTNKIVAKGDFFYTLISTTTGRPVKLTDDIISRYSV